jgi:hypothetical protein
MVLIVIVTALVAKVAGTVVAAAAAVEEMVTDVIPHTQKTVYHPLLQIWIVAMMVFQIMLRFCNPIPIY